MDVLEKQTGLDELKTRLRNTWMTGDYGRFCRRGKNLSYSSAHGRRCVSPCRTTRRSDATQVCWKR